MEYLSNVELFAEHQTILLPSFMTCLLHLNRGHVKRTFARHLLNIRGTRQYSRTQTSFHIPPLKFPYIFTSYLYTLAQPASSDFAGFLLKTKHIPQAIFWKSRAPERPNPGRSQKALLILSGLS